MCMRVGATPYFGFAFTGDDRTEYGHQSFLYTDHMFNDPEDVKLNEHLQIVRSLPDLKLIPETFAFHAKDDITECGHGNGVAHHRFAKYLKEVIQNV